MELGEFASAYRRASGDFPHHAPELDARLADVRRIAAQWGEIVHDALVRREVPQPEQWNEYVDRYWRWTRGGFGGVSQYAATWAEARMAEFDEADTDIPPEFLASLAGLGGELTFHRLNAKALMFWSSWLYGQPNGIEREIVERSCVDLAQEVLHLSGVRSALVRDDAFFTPELAALRAMHTGTLTEIDAYIALLDLTRRDPQLLVVPAPPQFERWAGAANADFLVVHRERGTIRGVQIKATIDHDQARRYDNARITLIDGARDLRNTRAMRTDARRSDRHVVSWPGIIGAHYLLDLRPGRLTDQWIPRRRLIQLKVAARHYAGNLVSQNEVAYDVVRERVLRDLDR